VHCQQNFCLKGERYTGGKHSQERLTVSFCGSMTGEIEKSMVIGMAMMF
jgi:hypothetical protein